LANLHVEVMHMKNCTIVLVLALILTAFSVGTLVTRNAQAQPVYSKLSGFPRQSELWSVSSYDPGVTWDPNINGYIFTVQRDAAGRLPVLTTIHGDSNTGLLYREVGGSWRVLERSDYSYGSAAQAQGRFHQAIGVLLPPGRYFLRHPGSELFVSGYWALP